MLVRMSAGMCSKHWGGSECRPVLFEFEMVSSVSPACSPYVQNGATVFVGKKCQNNFLVSVGMSPGFAIGDDQCRDVHLDAAIFVATSPGCRPGCMFSVGMCVGDSCRGGM
jgi:hypothetical protein